MWSDIDVIQKDLAEKEHLMFHVTSLKILLTSIITSVIYQIDKTIKSINKETQI